MPPKTNKPDEAATAPVETTSEQPGPSVEQPADMQAKVAELQKRLEEQMAQNTMLIEKLTATPNLPAPAISAEQVIEDGPTEPVTYFSKIAELRFSISIGAKIKDSKGNLIDPVPESFEFHSGLMTLCTKKRIFLAENYGPYGKHFWKTKAIVKEMPPKVEYTSGVTTAGSAVGTRIDPQ